MLRVLLLVGLASAACEDGGQTGSASSNSEDIQDAFLTTDGLGPVSLGSTFAQLEETSGIELYLDACDYAIEPGGYLNVVFDAEPDRSSDGGRTLVGLWLYEGEELSPSLTPTTPAGITFGSSLDQVHAQYPDARFDGSRQSVEYWVLESKGEDNDLVAGVTDGRVVGLGAGDARDLQTPNCS